MLPFLLFASISETVASILQQPSNNTVETIPQFVFLPQIPLHYISFWFLFSHTVIRVKHARLHNDFTMKLYIDIVKEILEKCCRILV